MKKHTLLLSIGLASLAMNASAQNEFQRDTVAMEEGYQKTVFYSLDTKNKTSIENNSWDLAFRTTPMTVGLYANQATKNWDVLQLFVESSNEALTAEDKFMTDLTAEFDNLSSSQDVDDFKLFNSISTWDTGAFNQWTPEDPQTNFNLGWGMYDMSTHKIVGQKVFAISKAAAFPGAPIDQNAPKYKIFVKEHDPVSAERSWEFWYAALDATTEAEITKITFNGADYGDKLFTYFNLADEEFINNEPDADTWDLTFTRYKELVTQGQQTMWYGVTGVLLNNQTAAFGALDITEDPDTDDDEVFNFIEWGDDITLSNEDIDVIGRAWRGGIEADEYKIIPNAYFVKSKENKTYHIRFRKAALGGAAPEGLEPGDIVFEYKMVDDGVSVSEWRNDYSFEVYPNPATDKITLRLENNAKPQVGEVVVTDMNGRHLLVKNQNLNIGTQTLEVDLSTLTSGMYMVYIQLDQGLISKKVVKK